MFNPLLFFVVKQEQAACFVTSNLCPPEKLGQTISHDSKHLLSASIVKSKASSLPLIGFSLLHRVNDRLKTHATPLEPY